MLEFLHSDAFESFFISTTCVDLVEMSHNVTAHLDLHCLSKHPLSVFRFTMDRMQHAG